MGYYLEKLIHLLREFDWPSIVVIIPLSRLIYKDFHYLYSSLSRYLVHDEIV